MVAQPSYHTRPANHVQKLCADYHQGVVQHERRNYVRTAYHASYPLEFCTDVTVLEPMQPLSQSVRRLATCWNALESALQPYVFRW